MDYCSRGDLLEYIRINGPLEEEFARQYFRYLISLVTLLYETTRALCRQITAAIQYLHQLDIAHRDLKCENIFITREYQLKLGDFGFARFCRDSLTGEELYSKTFCGSAAYAAPEILQVSFRSAKFLQFSIISYS